MDDEPILKVHSLKQHFKQPGGLFRKAEHIYALNGIDLSLKKGEVLGVVGQNGSGKSTLLRSIARLYIPSSGEIIFQGKNITHMHQRELLPLRKDMQMIFQDPYASLDPRMNVRQIISQPLQIFKKHGLLPLKNSQIEEKICTLIEKVGLCQDDLQRYPYEFSGGQRQRIGIARALILRPKLILSDEPVSALDACVQTQILKLLRSLQKQENLSCIFVSHDLNVVHYLANRIAVMYHGYVLEIAKADDLYHQPLHPYTQALLAAMPKISNIKTISYLPKNHKEISLNKDTLVHACPFVASCPQAQMRCRKEYPILHKVKNNHYVACFFSKK